MAHVCKENTLCLAASSGFRHSFFKLTLLGIVHSYLKEHCRSQCRRRYAEACYAIAHNALFIGKRCYPLRKFIGSNTAEDIYDYLGSSAYDTRPAFKHKQRENDCKHEKAWHSAVISPCGEEHYGEQKHKHKCDRYYVARSVVASYR